MNADPAWAHEKAELSPYDPRWPEAAARECARVDSALSPWLAAPAEHVGSTSIPGVTAKPILDLMAVVRDRDKVIGQVVAALAGAGWAYVTPGLDSGAAWRRFFVLPDATGLHRVAHLHVMDPGCPRWGQQMAFRDALRAQPALARDYEELKRGLAAEFGDDREAYTAAKGDFVARVMRDLGRTAG